MNIFLANKTFRQLTVNQWISTIGDTIFYLAFINYVSGTAFASLAVLLITWSETLPQIFQMFLGTLADFQRHRIAKYTAFTFVKFLLYLLVALLFGNADISLWTVVLVCLLNLVSDSLGFFAGAMLTPIYIRIIQEDMASAMGFRQSTTNLVRTLSNLAGGLLMGMMGIQLFAFVNALTFLLAFLGIWLIKVPLTRIEGEIQVEQQAVNLKAFCEHLWSATKLLLGLGDVMRLFTILAISQAVLSVTVPLVTLLLIQKPFMGLETGQTLAIMTSLELVGLMAGSFFSGNLLRGISTKWSIYLGQFLEGILLLGFFFQHYPLILVAVFGDALMTGITSPRLQGTLFSLIPEESMGAVQSAVGAFTVVVPGILSMMLTAIATGLGVSAVSVILAILLFCGCYLLLQMKGDLFLAENNGFED